MAENKKGFILYCDLIHTVEQLPNEKAGELFKHILRYVNDQNPITDDLITNITFEPIKQQLKRDLKQWEESISQKSISGRLGNLKRWNNDLYIQVLDKKISIEEAEIIANSRKISQPDSMQSHNIANIAVTVTDTVKVKVKNKREKSEKTFSPPIISEVISYFKDNGYTEESGKRAFNFYDCANWIDSKGNQVKNWKQKMQSVWFKEENKQKKEIPKAPKLTWEDYR